MAICGKTINTGICLFLGVAFLSTTHTADASLILLSESRSVQSSVSIETPTFLRSATTERRSTGDFGVFDFQVEDSATADSSSSMSLASQISEITSHSITGNGVANSELRLFDDGSANASASSSLETSFELTEPHRFSLFGELSRVSTSDSGQARVSLRNEQGTFDLSLSTPFFDGDAIPFDLGGTLFPDVYTLAARADMGIFGCCFDGEQGGISEFSLNFEVTSVPPPAVVPVPAALWLFGSGLLLLLASSAKKQL